MTKLESFIEGILDNAVRDICSVSVTAAPKSKVKSILQDLLAEVGGKVEGTRKSEEEYFKSLSITGDEDMSTEGTLRRNKKSSEDYGKLTGYNQALDDIKALLKK